MLELEESVGLAVRPAAPLSETGSRHGDTDGDEAAAPYNPNKR